MIKLGNKILENSSMFTDVYRGLVFIEVVTVSLKKKNNN